MGCSFDLGNSVCFNIANRIILISIFLVYIMGEDHGGEFANWVVVCFREICVFFQLF